MIKRELPSHGDVITTEKIRTIAHMVHYAIAMRTKYARLMASATTYKGRKLRKSAWTNKIAPTVRQCDNEQGATNEKQRRKTIQETL